MIDSGIFHCDYEGEREYVCGTRVIWNNRPHYNIGLNSLTRKQFMDEIKPQVLMHIKLCKTCVRIVLKEKKHE